MALPMSHLGQQRPGRVIGVDRACAPRSACSCWSMLVVLGEAWVPGPDRSRAPPARHLKRLGPDWPWAHDPLSMLRGRWTAEPPDRQTRVKYNDQAELDPSQMGGGGRGNGGKIAIGGGAGLIVLVLALLFGINPGDILGGQTAGPEQTTGSSPFAQCTRGTDIGKDRNCRFVAYTNSIQDYWGTPCRTTR